MDASWHIIDTCAATRHALQSYLGVPETETASWSLEGQVLHGLATSAAPRIWLIRAEMPDAQGRRSGWQGLKLCQTMQRQMVIGDSILLYSIASPKVVPFAELNDASQVGGTPTIRFMDLCVPTRPLEALHTEAQRALAEDSATAWDVVEALPRWLIEEPEVMSHTRRLAALADAHLWDALPRFLEELPYAPLDAADRIDALRKSPDWQNIKQCTAVLRMSAPSTGPLSWWARRLANCAESEIATMSSAIRRDVAEGCQPETIVSRYSERCWMVRMMLRLLLGEGCVTGDRA